MKISMDKSEISNFIMQMLYLCNNLLVTQIPSVNNVICKEIVKLVSIHVIFQITSFNYFQTKICK